MPAINPDPVDHWERFRAFLAGRHLSASETLLAHVLAQVLSIVIALIILGIAWLAEDIGTAPARIGLALLGMIQALWWVGRLSGDLSHRQLFPMLAPTAAVALCLLVAGQ